MSIVEKALKKLQASGGTPPRAEVHRYGSSPPVGRVVAVEVPASPLPRDPALRRPIGNPAKKILIDPDALRRSGLMPPEHQQQELSHQYRTLKRPLIRKAFDAEARATSPDAPSPRAIMVASALPGEGKTFTAINLALSLALEKDHGVLLVDGDAPKPHVSETFGLQDEPGLLNVITDPRMPIESVVLQTSVPGLSILPVGRRTETATEHLASARMRQLLKQLEDLDPYGLVVVDSPPILLTSEARVMASLFGQVVLVVRAGSTPQEAVTEAIGILGEGPRVGLVLNQAIHENQSGTYYGHRYRYGYPADAAGEGE